MLNPQKIVLKYEAHSPTNSYNRRHSAYTLIELIFSIALLLILIGVAAPSFAAFINRTEVAVDATKLFDTLHFARSEAIHRHQLIHVCQLSDTEDMCEGNYNSKRSWASGWMVFADINEDNDFSSADELLRVERLPGKTKIIFNQRGRLRFFPEGHARSSGFYVCNSELTATRHIYLLHSGRVRIRDNLTKRNQAICAADSS